MEIRPVQLDLSKLVALVDDKPLASANPATVVPARQRSLSACEPPNHTVYTKHHRRSLGAIQRTYPKPRDISSRTVVTRNQRYVDLLDRFQIRHVVSSTSSRSMKTSQTPRTGRSTKVHPGILDGTLKIDCDKHRFTDCSKTQSISSFRPTTQRQPGASEHIPEEPSKQNGKNPSMLMEWISGFQVVIGTPIHPTTSLARLRSVVMLVVVIAHAVYFPMIAAFLEEDESTILQDLEQAFQLTLVIDCGVSFNTAFMDQQGQLIAARSAIAWQYARGWLVPDLFSIIPMNWFLSKNIPPWVPIVADVVLHLPRFLHVMEITYHAWLPRLQDNDQSVITRLFNSRFSHLLRIVLIVFYIVLAAHYTACILTTLGVNDSAATIAPAFSQYVARMYDAFQLLQGQGITTTSTSQSAFASVLVLIGSVILAIEFGNVGILVSNFNANSTRYQRKMESVFATMKKLKLPNQLRERIHLYYEHLWQEYETLDGEIVAFTKDLSQTLILEVMMFKYMDLIMYVPFWCDGSPDFLKQLVLRVQVRVYMPDDYIIRRGEVGNEFYMVNRGVCELVVEPDSLEGPFLSTEVVEASLNDNSHYHLVDSAAEVNPPSQDGTQCGVIGPNFRFLRRGQSFGELALLMDYERTANARALTYVELCVLDRVAVQEVFSNHPKDRKAAIEKMVTRSLEHSEDKKIPCPLRQIMPTVFGYELSAMSTADTAFLITAAINAQGEDTSIKYEVGASLSEKLSIEKTSGGCEDLATSNQGNKANFDDTDATDMGPTFAAISTRLVPIYTSQLQLLSAIEALRAELQAAKRSIAKGIRIHSEACESYEDKR